MQPPAGYAPVRFQTLRDLIEACKGKQVYQDADGEMIFRDASNIPIVYVRYETKPKVNLKYFKPVKY